MLKPNIKVLTAQWSKAEDDSEEDDIFQTAYST